MKKIFALLLITAILFPHNALAAVAQPVDVEFSVARACHFYDSGNLKEAMAEFETVLKQDPYNKAACEYMEKIRTKINETGISKEELNERITGYRNVLTARKKIEITDPYKPALDRGQKPYDRFINQTSFGYNDRHFETDTDKSFTPDGFFVTEHIRMDNALKSPITAGPKKRMPKPKRTSKWNEFTFDATKSYDPDKQKLSFCWDFGDGATSNEPVTRHAYTIQGDYTVTLTVKDDSGLTCDTAMAQQIIKVYPDVLDPSPGPETYMTTVGDDYQSTFTLDALYHDDSYDSARIRRIMYSLSNPGGMRFIAGDTSTRLSRYIMRGMYYRGVNFALNDDINEFKILYGAAPHFMAKTTGGVNKDQNIYIYPRKVLGARDAIKIMDGYKVGVSFMELRDSERVRTIDPNYNPKLNRVFSIDQSIEAVPGKWHIETENAFSTSDEDRSDKDIFSRDDRLKDTANYIRSEIALTRFRLINSYEIIGTDFRSYSDLASTTTSWVAGLTSDREKIDNYLEYRPFQFDPIFLDLYFSRIRSNFDRDVDIPTMRDKNYGVDLKYTPENETWIPQSAIRLKVMDKFGTSGSQYASNDVSDRDIIFELAKKLYGVDLNGSYTYRNEVDNIDTYKTYSNIYNIRAAKELTEMILFSAEYEHYDIYDDQDTVGGMDYLNLGTALRLWTGANLSLDYSREDRSDKTGRLQDSNINTYSTTFSWPWSHYFLDSGQEFNIAPYFTYQLSQGETAESKNRYIWTAACDANYQLAKDHRISASFLYRQDENDYYDPNTTSSSRAIEDRRFLLTYKKIFQ